MAINFNRGDKIVINQDFVSSELELRAPTPERKSLLSRLHQYKNNDLLVATTIDQVSTYLIKIIPIKENTHGVILTFESQSDLNNSFTLVEAFEANQHLVTAINGDATIIGAGHYVTLSGYQETNPQIPVISAPKHNKVEKSAIFGITMTPIPSGESGIVLIEGFFKGVLATDVIYDACYLGMDGDEVLTVPGNRYRSIAVSIDPEGLIYFPKQPAGPYDCFEPRSYSGRGNNKQDWDRGMAGSPLVRWGKSSYLDGKSMLPKRPNARAISNAIVAQTKTIVNDKNVTDYLWVWGQFLDHDIGLTEAAFPEELANITIPANDPFFPPGDLSFKRSKYDPATGTTNVRQQINSQSSYIDASNIYGSSIERSMALRTNDGTGKLKTSAGNLLPYNTTLVENAPNNHDPQYFLAGDIRANEQLILTAMHTLWVREHNRLAEEIFNKNSHLTGDQIFQSARRKVIALNQAITFNEFLPTLLGSSAIPAYSGYDETINPSISNEFSTGLYRLGHSMVSTRIQRLDANLKTIPQGWTSLRDAFFRPDRITEGGIDPLLRGAAKQRSSNIDISVVDELRNFLFGNPGAGGLDLAALNIQRGRDHGLPSYNEMRVILGLPAAKSYAEITTDTEVRSKLVSIYSNINEIDLWVGMLAEDHLEGSMVGETLQTGLIRQFVALRDGDRFWYERVFSGELLDEIKSTKLSDVIKRNTGIGAELQENVFYLS